MLTIAFRHRIFLLLTMCVLGHLAHAAEEGPGVERVRFFGLSIEQGLAQPTVRAIAQDHQGFLWIGSQDGLSRYDGHEFEVFRRQAGDADGLGDNHITALAVDGEGALWIGTQAGGLARRDPNTGEISHKQWAAGDRDGLAFGQIAALLWHPTAGLLVATGDGVIHRQEGGGWTVPALGLTTPTGPVRSMRVGPNGELLIAARNGAWRCQEGHCDPSLTDEIGRSVDAYDLVVDVDGSLWVASTERGVFRYSPAGELLERLHTGGSEGRQIGDDSTRRLLIDRSGRLWIAHNAGAARLSPDRKQVRNWRYRPASAGGLPASRVHTLFEGRNGLLWFGTWTEGLALLDPATEAFVSITADASLPGALPFDVVTAVLANADGTLWMGLGSTGGLVHFDLQKGVLAHFKADPNNDQSLSHNFVQHLARDRDGQLWIATQGGGLNRMRPDGKTFDRFQHDPNNPTSIAGDHLISLYFDTDNTLWISTLDAGLDRLCSGCTEFAHYRNAANDPTSIAADTINSCFEDGAGNFWVALRPGGLNLLDRATGKVTRIQTNPSDPSAISSNTITALMEDRHGQLWIGTQGGGINLLQSAIGERPRFRKLTRADGLGSDAIGGMFEDERGDIWASTTTGVSRIDPEQWKVQTYGGRDGAQASGYFIGSQARLPDGRLVFGGLRGATVFSPTELGDRRSPGQVILTRARSLASKDLDVDQVVLADRIRNTGSLRLHYPARDLSFEFSALAFNAPEGLRYRYQLEGLDRDWVYSEPRRRFAGYTNLPAGSYRFRVQATIGERLGPESDIGLIVDPEPGISRWVLIGYALIALGLFGAFASLLVGRWRERASAAERLRESEEQLKLALWGTGDELWDLDLRNDSMKRMNPLPFLAAPRVRDVGRASDMLRYVHPDDRELPGLALRRHLRGETDIYEVIYRVLDSTSEWRWLRSRGRVVERAGDGQALRLAGTVSDITPIKLAEIDLQNLNHDLERRVDDRTTALTKANATLQGTVTDLRLAQRQLVDAEKMAALGGLVAGVAHEINTPLGISVTAASHLQGETRRLKKLLDSSELKRSDLDAYEITARESSELILRNLQRADKLVKSFKQVAVDQSSEERRHIFLAQYIDEILTSLRPALKRAQHQIIVDCPADLGFVTLPGAIYQVFANLLMNTLTHAFEPDTPGEIRIEASIKADQVLLSYADNGRGMNDDARARIFEPFFTTRRGNGGSGLGMHIVFNLVTQALGGTIECDSAHEQGVYFSIRLPLIDVRQRDLAK